MQKYSGIFHRHPRMNKFIQKKKKRDQFHIILGPIYPHVMCHMSKAKIIVVRDQCERGPIKSPHGRYDIIKEKEKETDSHFIKKEKREKFCNAAVVVSCWQTP